ncbi:ABC transporter permease [candidate division WWE3 bacterium]|uniref:ABC transporter permease n=1 Tax=candidate division WWE3 bacterium TaxID=2053526 RepID=A0A955LWA1_UNCKA|nr:ABC transporter permease [candidate division WWE3 bacterium]
MFSNIRSALTSIWNHKVRSLLTVLGVVIGVSSVTTLVSLGQGLKNDVSSLIQGFGTNVIVVVSGSFDESQGAQINPANIISGDILTLEDIDDIAAMPEIKAVTPISLVGGALKYEEESYAPTFFGVFPNVLEAFEVLELEKGQTFNSRDAGDVIVLAGKVAEGLFGTKDPIGKKVLLGERELEVIGVLGESTSASIFGSEFDNIAAIPFDTATDINDGEVSIMRIVMRASDDADVSAVKEEVTTRILDNHDGEEDFTVLTQDDMLALFNQFLDLSTALVSAIAAISLIVGGIGIMNIMLVTVTERTREIGLRKAVGATKFAIMMQFLTEAIVITFVGGLIGLGVSVAAGLVVASQTPLQPEITLQVVLTAIGISSVIGVIFGLWPALRAANKDPIEALRYE